MEEKFTAIVFKSTEAGEYDKRITLITPMGLKIALAKGVRRPKAKLKAACVPFAFFEYTAIKKGNTLVLTGAHQIEDLSLIALNLVKLTAGSIILEAAFFSLKNESQNQFVFMLKRLKDIIYFDEGSSNSLQNDKDNSIQHIAPYLSAIRFLQYIIHDAGYAYNYKKESSTKIDSALKLLSALSFLNQNEAATVFADSKLVAKTLIMLSENFESKFDCKLLSKDFIAFDDNSK